MRRIGLAVRVLLVIALFGLHAGVQAQGADDGLVAEWHFDDYFGDDSDAREDYIRTLPITVRAEAENGRGGRAGSRRIGV